MSFVCELTFLVVDNEESSRVSVARALKRTKEAARAPVDVEFAVDEPYR